MAARECSVFPLTARIACAYLGVDEIDEREGLNTMRDTIYLDKSAVPAALRGSYTGTKFEVEVCTSVHIPMTAGLWDGGSRDTYTAIRTVDGSTVTLSDSIHAPWDAARRSQDVTLTPGICVVEHRIFCGKDMGLRFYLHPVDAAPLLPAPAQEMTACEQLVLNYTVSRKSSYMGKDRYAMARDDLRYGYVPEGAPRPVMPSRGDWDAAKTALIARGLLNKAGAITTLGKNQAKYI
jgi:hypothetical protein